MTIGRQCVLKFQSCRARVEGLKPKILDVPFSRWILQKHLLRKFGNLFDSISLTEIKVYGYLRKLVIKIRVE